MHKFEKKLIAIMLSLAFIIIGVSSASAIETNETEKKEGNSSFPITLYRHGFDGSVTPIKFDLILEEGKDIGEAIADKCQELFENDVELQEYLTSTGIKLGFICKIKSRGRGFHYETKLFEKLLLRFIRFRLALPRLNTLLTSPLVFCKYKKDLKANTTIKSLLSNTSKYMSGNHTVIVHNFIGYTSWLRRFSFSPLNLLPKSLFGVAKFAICIKLP